MEQARMGQASMPPGHQFDRPSRYECYHCPAHQYLTNSLHDINQHLVLEHFAQDNANPDTIRAHGIEILSFHMTPPPPPPTVPFHLPTHGFRTRKFGINRSSTDHLPLGEWYYCPTHPTWINTDLYELNRHFTDDHPGDAKPTKEEAIDGHLLMYHEAVGVFGEQFMRDRYEKRQKLIEEHLRLGLKRAGKGKGKDKGEGERGE